MLITIISFKIRTKCHLLWNQTITTWFLTVPASLTKVVNGSSSSVSIFDLLHAIKSASWGSTEFLRFTLIIAAISLLFKHFFVKYSTTKRCCTNQNVSFRRAHFFEVMFHNPNNQTFFLNQNLELYHKYLRKNVYNMSSNFHYNQLKNWLL